MQTNMGMMVYHADVGGTVALTAEVVKGAAASGTLPTDLAWTSSDPDVAKIEGSGGAATVTGVAPGYADIGVAGTLDTGRPAGAFCKVQVHSATVQQLVLKGPAPR